MESPSRRSPKLGPSNATAKVNNSKERRNEKKRKTPRAQPPPEPDDTHEKSILHDGPATADDDARNAFRELGTGHPHQSSPALGHERPAEDRDKSHSTQMQPTAATGR